MNHGRPEIEAIKQSHQTNKEGKKKNQWSRQSCGIDMHLGGDRLLAEIYIRDILKTISSLPPNSSRLIYNNTKVIIPRHACISPNYFSFMYIDVIHFVIHEMINI